MLFSYWKVNFLFNY